MAKREGNKVVTNEVRLSYLHVFEKFAATPGQEEKYSVCLLIDKKDKETLRFIQEGIDDATNKGQGTKWGGKVPKNLKLPLRDGDEEKDTDEHPEYAGKFFLNASSAKMQPQVIDLHKKRIYDPNGTIPNVEPNKLSDETLKSGDYGKVSINFFPFAAAGNNGIGVGLNHIMKTRDGEALGGSAASAESDFEGEFEDEGGLLD